jgi:hypothetical protein
MGVFEQRKEGFEKRFVADEALNFKATARRNRLLALWVAELTRKNPAQAEADAKALVASQVERADDEALFETLRGELQVAGVEMSDHRIRRKMAETLAKTRKDIAAGL